MPSPNITMPGHDLNRAAVPRISIGHRAQLWLSIRTASRVFLGLCSADIPSCPYRKAGTRGFIEVLDEVE